MPQELDFVKGVKVMQVIRTTNLRRGDGKTTPIRCITQYWSLDGELLAEVDPLPASDAADVSGVVSE